MNGFATSPNPYLCGIKPKTFFGVRNAMIKKEKMMSEVDKNYYPKKDIQANTLDKLEIRDPWMKEFVQVLPWIISLSFLLLSLF